MLNGKPAIGAEVNLGSALSAELISPLGFDFILVDNQHGACVVTSRNPYAQLSGYVESIPLQHWRKLQVELTGAQTAQGGLAADHSVVRGQLRRSGKGS